MTLDASNASMVLLLFLQIVEQDRQHGEDFMAATTTTTPAFASALSTLPETAEAVAEVCQQASSGLTGRPALALVFISPHHEAEVASVAAAIAEQTQAASLLGCTGESIVGTGREIEGQPAISLWLAQLPGVAVQPMHLRYERTPEGGTIIGWPDDLPEPWPEGSALFLLGEPFTFPTDLLLQRLNEDRPGVPVIGGMASGAHQPGGNRLLLGGEEITEGAVAALIHGPVEIRSIVSQGCRPVGQHYVVTKAERNIIHELGGKPPLAQLQKLFPSLTPEEQRAVQSGLHVGVVINEYQDTFSRGDFLIRNVVGADPEIGAIAIGDYVRVGQTVQFHIRDQQSADEDLRELTGQAGAGESSSAQGALLFTCNGRGTRLFDEPHHDASVLQSTIGEIPLAGFFAQGEIGPVGGKNFVHGFTASVAVFSGKRQ